MTKLHSDSLRTVEVARAARYSVQQVRDLEREGVLPAARRSPGGHRNYRPVHVAAARAYRALTEGTGPVAARTIMRDLVAGETGRALAGLDAAHAALHTERGELALAVRAATEIGTEPIADVRASDALNITELADALGVRTSTLRHWEAMGLIVADRAAGARRYSPAQVRDARIVHQLRRAGYGITTLRAVLTQFRRSGPGELRDALAAREATLTRRSMALVEAAADLTEVLRDQAPRARALC
ncbi:MerR family transcriptional regulator [Nocardia caishijiensis]|uniref:DNA-binding transcriptional MerR regulator n=1 Tax=Nocardia caishijiensis TaxID=184756 RepID=A0ABQ6YRD9_9NOCA|nr:MerR family transcriptional regulator [Nocardia caishijiensis]KAF0848120.1 DNA-binding transcriptional MerR regulator [Nocardia caishijiensis]